MNDLSQPVEVCLQRLDMIYVQQYAQASRSSVGATVRELVHEAIVARDRKNRPDLTAPPVSRLPQGPEGKKGVASERIGPKGKSGRKMRTIPQTIAERDKRAKQPKYEITSVSHTEEEEL